MQRSSPRISPRQSPRSAPNAVHGGLTLPRANLAMLIRRDPTTGELLPDSIGVSSRPVQKKWHLMGDGAGYLSHADIVGTETVVSKAGTATVTIAAGRVDVGVGTLWSLVLSNGSQYEYPTLITASYAVMFDVSGNGRHLVLTDYTLATAIVESLVTGSDWLNQNGYTVADGSQYFSAVSFGLIPNDVLIPALADGSGCAAYEVVQ